MPPPPKKKKIALITLHWITSGDAQKGKKYEVDSQKPTFFKVNLAHFGFIMKTSPATPLSTGLGLVDFT